VIAIILMPDKNFRGMTALAIFFGPVLSLRKAPGLTDEKATSSPRKGLADGAA